jgi:hypothetical protein
MATSVMRGIKTTVAALLAAGLLATCGGGGPTRGSQCKQVMTTFCNRASKDCGQFDATQIQPCIDAGTSSCCAGNCGAGVVSTQQDIDACDLAIGAATCASLDVLNGGTLPMVCVAVVRSALTSTAQSALRSSASDDSSGVRVGRLLAQ